MEWPDDTEAQTELDLEQSDSGEKKEKKLQPQVTAKKKLIDSLELLHLLPSVLIPIVVDYFLQGWDVESRTTWKFSHEPFGISTYQDQIYVCCPFPDLVLIKNFNGKTIRKCAVDSPGGIDIDTNHSLVYIAGHAKMSIFNFQLEIRSS